MPSSAAPNGNHLQDFGLRLARNKDAAARNGMDEAFILEPAQGFARPECG